MKWVTLIFENAILQQKAEEADWYQLTEGSWDYPFPNEEGNSQAFGLFESFAQSDNGWSFCEEAGNPIRIVITTDRAPIYMLDYTNRHRLMKPIYSTSELSGER